MLIHLSAVQVSLTNALNHALVRSPVNANQESNPIQEAMRLLRTIGAGPLHEIQVPLRHLIPYPLDTVSHALPPAEAWEYVLKKAIDIAALIYCLRESISFHEAQMAIGALTQSSEVDEMALLFDPRFDLIRIGHSNETATINATSALTMVLDATSRTVGKDFLHSLVEHLARSFNCQFAFVSMIGEETSEVELLALWAHDRLASNFRYPLQGKPCEHVMRDGMAYFDAGVAKRFSEDRWLLEQNIESYFAIAFTDNQGKPMGHLGIMSQAPIALNEDHRRAFKLLSDRAGAEVERIITDRHLKESEARLRQIAENLEEVVVLSTPRANRILYVNPAFGKVWGVPIQDFYRDASVWLQSLHPDDRPAVTAAFQAMLERGSFNQDYRIIRPSGEIAWVHGRAYPVRDPNGNVIAIAAIGSDITERKRLEVSLRQAQKMEALGTAVGGIGHDFNNILQIFRATVESAKETLGSIPISSQLTEALADLDMADQTAKRAARLINGMMEFAKPKEYQFEIFDIGKILQTIGKQVSKKAIAANTNLTLKLEISERCYSLVDVNKMEAVVLNLATNALHAIGGQGRITIRTYPVNLDQQFCATRSSLEPGSYIAISVSDDGVGIPPENIGKLFDPFFTTKKPGEGTGLGLAMVYAKIKAHRGFIEVQSEPNHGSTFTFYLPASNPPPPSSELISKPKSYVAKPGFKILLVDDEELLRFGLIRIISRLGFETFEAENGQRALEIYRQHKPDLVIIDYHMPKMDGMTVSTQMLSENPGLPIILSTGNGDDSNLDKVRNAGIKACLTKPYGKDDLIRHLAALGAMVEDEGTQK